MNRQQRNAIAAAGRAMLAKILREPTWQGRWHGFASCMIAMRGFAEQQRFDFDAVDIGGRFAAQIVAASKASAIGDCYQAILYFLSRNTAHRLASELWQIEHPAEMAELRAEHPEAFGELDPAQQERVGFLAIAAAAGLDASELRDLPEHGLCVSESGLRKLVAIAPNPGPGQYLLEQLVQQRRRELHVADNNDDKGRRQ